MLKSPLSLLASQLAPTRAPASPYAARVRARATTIVGTNVDDDGDMQTKWRASMKLEGEA